MEKFIAEGIAVLAVIGVMFLKDFLTWYKNNGKLKFFDNNIEIDMQIKRELKYVVDKIGFNRVSVIKYHNGTESFDGFSFNFATMTHEEVDDITVRILKDFQKIPLTSFTEVLYNLKNTDDRYVVVKSDGSNSGIMQAGWNVEQSYNFLLSDRVSDGIICCANTHIHTELTQQQILEIRAIAYKINLLLSKRK